MIRVVLNYKSIQSNRGSGSGGAAKAPEIIRSKIPTKNVDVAAIASKLSINSHTY